jgi:spoIIIJ-associated protein
VTGVEWVETTGRSVEEAKDAALDQLGVDEQDAEFEILEEPRSGLFGRLRSEARVRARVKPKAPRPKDERRRGRSRDGGRSAGTKGRSDAPGRSGGDGGENDSGPASPRAPRSSPPRTRREPSAAKVSSEENGSMVEEMTLAEQGEVARTFVTGLIESFGADAQVSVREIDDETIEVVADGANLGLLIGPKGQTLSAVQELTRTVVQRQSAARTGRIMVDVAGWRQKRREALERFTKQIAEEVLSSNATKVLEPMAAADRKVVHDTINDIDGLETASEGEEPRRRVVIRPAG